MDSTFEWWTYWTYLWQQHWLICLLQSWCVRESMVSDPNSIYSTRIWLQVKTNCCLLLYTMNKHRPRKLRIYILWPAMTLGSWIRSSGTSSCRQFLCRCTLVIKQNISQSNPQCSFALVLFFWLIWLSELKEIEFILYTAWGTRDTYFYYFWKIFW